MNRMIVLGGIAAAVTLTMGGTASASCSDRKATGTIIGGIGGALIGNSLSGGGGGAILGGLGGAVAGHAIAGSGCGRYRHSYYERRSDYDRSGYYGSRETAYRGSRETSYAPVRTIYYDARGNPLPQAAPVSYAQSGYRPASYATSSYGQPACGSQSYYDSRGNLVQQPVTNCR